MTRRWERYANFGLDVGLLSAALWLAVLVRFEGPPPESMFERLVVLWPSIVLLQYAALKVFGVPRYVWRLVGLREVTRILSALALACAVLLLARLVAGAAQHHLAAAEHLIIPVGVILIDFCLAFLAIAGVRALRRGLALREESAPPDEDARAPRPTLLIGAGETGRRVAHELTRNPQLGMRAVGFIDDDGRKTGLEIHGLNVLGATTSLPEIIRETGASDVLVTFPRASGACIRRISNACRESGVRVHIVPGLPAVVSGSVVLSDVREVAVEDLLRREPVDIEEHAVAADLNGRAVLVTGAGGSIGSELCRQIARYSPAALLLVERAEHALFEVHRDLAERFPGVFARPIVADVCDAPRIDEIVRTHRPEVIYHAAAHKHVPMMEANPTEGIKNNVGGTRIVAECAHRHSVAVFAMISTDKAVNPSSVMGASKRVAELCVQALADTSETRFVTVRFGNVLGSAGSVIPLFQKQLAHGGPLTVTHPEMRRYFMTIPEACKLVLQASSMGQGGEIFILDMGEPVRIADLARDMIELSGLVPGEDVHIEYTGLRPGEKLYEELYVSGKNPALTRHPKIFTGRGRPRQLAEVSVAVDALLAASAAGDGKRALRELETIVPEYRRPTAEPGREDADHAPAPPRSVARLSVPEKHA